MVSNNGIIGETYMIGGNLDRKNLEIVKTVCHLLDEFSPRESALSHADLIEFVTDRPGHDFRYAIDTSETTAEIGWKPTISLEEGLRQTVQWYLDHPEWWQKIFDRDYDGKRLGLNRVGSGSPTSAKDRI